MLASEGKLGILCLLLVFLGTGCGGASVPGINLAAAIAQLKLEFSKIPSITAYEIFALGGGPNVGDQIAQSAAIYDVKRYYNCLRIQQPEVGRDPMILIPSSYSFDFKVDVTTGADLKIGAPPSITVSPKAEGVNDLKFNGEVTRFSELAEWTYQKALAALTALAKDSAQSPEVAALVKKDITLLKGFRESRLTEANKHISAIMDGYKADDPASKGCGPANPPPREGVSIPHNLPGVTPSNIYLDKGGQEGGR